MIISAGDVFKFVGADSSTITSDTDRVTDIILGCQSELESMIGRKVDDTDVTDVILSNGINCEIIGSKLYLKGEGRDLYSITSLYENGILLNPVTTYNDGNHYFLDSAIGCIHRVGQFWSLEFAAIKITGKINISHTADIHEGVKLILIEMVAAKSGLWKYNIETEGGTVVNTRVNINKDTQKAIDSLKLRGI